MAVVTVVADPEVVVGGEFDAFGHRWHVGDGGHVRCRGHVGGCRVAAVVLEGL